MTQGEQGDQGEKGDRGIRGLAGEIGKIGLKGNQGNRGNPGEQGKPGQTGARGTTSHRRLEALAVFTLLGLIFLAYRTEVNARDLKDTVHDECLIRDANIGTSIDLYKGLIDIERHNPYKQTSPETINRRIDLYTKAMPERVDCGGK